jgi:hypothetical protein
VYVGLTLGVLAVLALLGWGSYRMLKGGVTFGGLWASRYDNLDRDRIRARHEEELKDNGPPFYSGRGRGALRQTETELSRL